MQTNITAAVRWNLSEFAARQAQPLTPIVSTVAAELELYEDALVDNWTAYKVATEEGRVSDAAYHLRETRRVLALVRRLQAVTK